MLICYIAIDNKYTSPLGLCVKSFVICWALYVHKALLDPISSTFQAHCTCSNYLCMMTLKWKPRWASRQKRSRTEQQTVFFRAGSPPPCRFTGWLHMALRLPAGGSPSTPSLWLCGVCPHSTAWLEPGGTLTVSAVPAPHTYKALELCQPPNHTGHLKCG